MNDNGQGANTPDTLARQVVDLAKASILADNHFLATALGRLTLARSTLAAPFATDGACLAYDPEHVLATFKETAAAPAHDVLHTALHCLFVHPYVDALESSTAWDLACDIAAERATSELLGPRPGTRGADILRALSRIERDTGTRSHAERIYRELRHGRWAAEAEQWTDLFASDSHELWYKPAASQGESEGQGVGAGNSQSGGVGRAPGNADSLEHTPGENSQGHEATPQARGNAESQGVGNEPEGGQREHNRNERHAPAHAQGTQAGSSEGSLDADGAQRSLQQIETHRQRREREQEEWRNVATSLAVNLQTFSTRRGRELGELVDDLQAASTPRADYAAFLRRFATPGEALRLNDEEFDQIFYTFGMQLYGDMPLIEPLEYREERRIREFVIAIDTSESVQGDAIRAFVNTTFELLKTTEAFFERVHVRILQCDAGVQADDAIGSIRDLEHWNRTMRIRGGGGTDFRPAFAYVDTLVEQGEFFDLGGLVYFTDGKGTYPAWVPRYRCAFVFYDEDHRAAEVPPWAAQIVLGEDDLVRAGRAITRKETALL